MPPCDCGDRGHPCHLRHVGDTRHRGCAWTRSHAPGSPRRAIAAPVARYPAADRRAVHPSVSPETLLSVGNSTCPRSRAPNVRNPSCFATGREMLIAFDVLPRAVHDQVRRHSLQVFRVTRPRHDGTRSRASLRKQRVLPRLGPHGFHDCAPRDRTPSASGPSPVRAVSGTRVKPFEIAFHGVSRQGPASACDRVRDRGRHPVVTAVPTYASAQHQRQHQSPTPVLTPAPTPVVDTRDRDSRLRSVAARRRSERRGLSAHADIPSAANASCSKRFRRASK